MRDRMSEDLGINISSVLQLNNLRGSKDSTNDLLLPHASSIHNTLFLIGMASIFVVLILGIYTCRRSCQTKKIIKETASPRGSFQSIFGMFPSAIKILGIDIVEKEETMHLLSNASMYDNKAPDGQRETISSETRSSELGKKFTKSSSSTKRARYFRDSDVRDGNDTMLMLAFTSVMSIGIFLNLHTTYGVRMVCITMVGDEVRWQAVKQSSSKAKRYKLNLLDVISVEAGKQQGHLEILGPEVRADSISPKVIICLDSSEFENLCFSLVTQKTSLYLEAASKLDRDCLVRGFQLRLETLRS